MKIIITVTANKFHGGDTLYEGVSQKQAVKAARRHDCHSCRCGGPVIIDGAGRKLYEWQATPPFQTANTPFWDVA